MLNKKDTLKTLQKEIYRKEKVRKNIGAEFDSLSENENPEYYQLEYLAELLVEIFLGNKCREDSHKIKKCEDCRKGLSLDGF